jgi:RecA-family ATPase
MANTDQQVENVPGVNADGTVDVMLYEPLPLSWAVQGVFVLKEANVIFGTGAGCKSTLMADLAVCAVYGLPWLGRELIQGRVLYLDWESSGDTVAWRVKRILRAKGLEAVAGQFMYKRMRAPIVRELEAIRELIASFQPTYLIVDSMGFAIGGDTQKETLVLEVFERLSGPIEEHGICLIFVDHTPHADKEKEFGSEYKRNAVRAQWLVREDPSRKSEKTDDGELAYLELVSKKLSFRRGDDSINVRILFHDTFSGRASSPLELADGPIQVSTYSPFDIPCAPGATASKELIVLNALPGTAREVSERTGIALSYVKDILSKLRKKRDAATNKGVWIRLRC